MNWTNVRLILAREIRDQLRDRRTMFMIVVLPILLYPFMGMSLTQLSQFVGERPAQVLVLGARNLPEAPPLLNNDRFAARWFTVPDKARLLEIQFAREEPVEGAGEPAIGSYADAKEAIREGRYEAAVYFPPDFGDRLDAFQDAVRRRAEGASGAEKVELAVPKPEIFFTTANEKSQVAFARVSEVMRRWTAEIGRSTLAGAGMPASAAAPVEPEVIDVAGETGMQGAAVWSKILPVLLVIWALTGAFYPAVDLCAGEKERGTLETLLSSPARRSEIVLGKLVTIMLFSGVTAVLNVASMEVLGSLALQRLPGFGPPPLAGSLWLLVALVPASALFGALCLALAAFARSTKEGQYYLMPLLLVVLPLALIPSASGMELTLGNSLIPVTGMVLLLRTALEGNTWQALQFLPPVFGATLLCCAAAIRWAVEQFNKESVLFRESERLELGLWFRRAIEDRGPVPTPAAALAGFFASFVMPAPRDFAGVAAAAAATQFAVVLAPALLLTALAARSPRQTLLLRLPPWKAAPAAVLLAVFLHPLVDGLRTVVMRLYPVSEEMEHALRGLESLFGGAPTWQLLLVVALLPAVCEELAFRGFILSGFRQSGAKWPAILYSAIFFGLSHSILQQSLIASVLGVVIGLIAYQTRSLLPGMLFHLTHNGLAVLSTKVPADGALRWPGLEWFVTTGEQGGLVFLWPALAVATVASVALLAWFQRHPQPAPISAEESAVEEPLRMESP